MANKNISVHVFWMVLLACVVGFAAANLPANAATIYVDVADTSGTEDGTQAQYLPLSQNQQIDETKSDVLARFFKTPLHFVANQRQFPEEVVYYAKSEGATVYCTEQGLIFGFAEGSISLKFSEDRRVRPEEQDELPGKVNYFIGNDKAKWHTDIPTYQKVVYREVYPGIDLVYSGNQRRLKYTLYLQPGANPNQIQMIYEGIEDVSIDDATGELVIQTEWGEMHDAAPVAYQEIEGVRKGVDISFRLLGENIVDFALGDYDPNFMLTLDPGYSTYLGGNPWDEGYGIAVDSSGNAYVAGVTRASNFPTQNPYQDSYGGGNSDAFVTKLSSSGNTLTYSTYLGGSNIDQGWGIAVDGSGNAYVTGYTESFNFPIQNPYDGNLSSGNSDAFVTKLSSSGNTLIYSTYLGGGNYDGGYGIAVDSSGNAYVTGYTGSSNFPIRNPYDDNLSGARGQDAFVTKIDTTQSGNDSLVYSTYLGGSNTEWGYGIAVDSNGNAYVTGKAGSDAFVTRLSSSGDTLIYSVYLGGSDTDYGNGIAVDGNGNAYVTGLTRSSDFPILNQYQDSYEGGDDAFVASFLPNGALETTIPPSIVTNLSASNPTLNSITLTWTAPDDGGVGRASQYDIRYATSPITEASWNAATECQGEPTPQVTGSTETFTVTNLLPSMTYYFAIKTADEVPNWSPMSNVAIGRTPPQTVYVNGTTGDDATGERGNPEKPFLTIQAGIDAASTGDTVLVKYGTYNITSSIDFNGKNIKLASDDGTHATYETAVTDASQCIIDAGRHCSVFRFHKWETSDAVVNGFTIRNGYGGGGYIGGGISCNDSSPTIINNIITSNSASYRGGGISCESSSPPTITKPTITNNIITENSAGKSGGGIYCIRSSPTIENNIIAGNSASTSAGGGINCQVLSSPKIINNTIIDNSASSGGGIYCWWNGSFPTIINTILWGNSPQEIYFSEATVTISYSDIQGGQAGIVNYGTLNWLDGNINADPLFFDATNGDYRLQPGSPCIDTGKSDSAPSTDIRGYPRPLGNIVDMGAYENAIPTISSLNPNHGTRDGGTTVTIIGKTFVDGAAVMFGEADATSVTVDSNTRITVVTPAGNRGPVDVTITNPYGLPSTLINGFAYNQIYPVVDSPKMNGSEFWVDIACHQEDLFNISFKLNYDTTVLDAVAVEITDALGIDLVSDYNVNETEGRVGIGISRKDPAGNTNVAGSIARVKFAANAQQETDVTFSFSDVHIYQADGTEFPSGADSADVTITVIGAVPTALASDIANVPTVMYQDMSYSLSSKYSDQNGYDDLNYLWLTFDNGEDDITLQAEAGTDATNQTATVTQGSSYVTSATYDRSSSGTDTTVTWYFTLNDTWTESTEIDLIVQCRDDENNASQADTLDANIDYVIDRAAPTNVGLNTPANNATDVSVDTALTILTAADSGVGLADQPYWIEIATDTNFTENFQDSDWIDSTSWPPPKTLTPGTVYYWRVKTKDKIENESLYCGHTADTQGYGTFTTHNSTPTALASDITGVPTVIFQDKSYTTTSKYSDADGYADLDELWLTFDNGDNDIVFKAEDGDSGTSIQTIIESDSDYVTSATYDRTSSGNDITINWTFTLNNSWIESSAIDLIVKCDDKHDAASTPDTLDANIIYDNDVEPPTNVGLNTPANNAMDILIDTALTILTATDAGIGLAEQPYQIEIATDSAFTQDVQNSGWIAQTSWTPPTQLSAGTTYYWHIKAKDKYDNESDFCGHTTDTAGYGTFSTDGNAPTNVGLSVPANNASAVHTDSTLTILTATDAGVGLANQPYFVQLATNPEFTEGLQESDWISSTTFDPDLLPAATYYWRVKAKDGYGNESDYCGHVADTAGRGTFSTAYYVWPGDLNNNGAVNEEDLHPLGQYWDSTGPARARFYQLWSNEPAEPWDTPEMTYADANGTGVIDEADVLPIGFNWAKTHQVPPQPQVILVATESSPPLTVIAPKVVKPGDKFTVSVKLGDDTRSVDDLFGVSFALQYTVGDDFNPVPHSAGDREPTPHSVPQFIKPTEVQEQKLIGEHPLHVVKIDAENGVIGYGVTRKAGQGGVDKNGIVAKIDFKVSDKTPLGTPIDLSIIRTTVKTADNKQVPVNINSAAFVVGYLGDVTLDSEIDKQDATTLLRHVVGLRLLSRGQQLLADVSDDGTVSAYDVSLILQQLAGIIDRFPQDTGQ